MPPSVEPLPSAASARDAAEVSAWASSGAMALTGRPSREPLGPPQGLVGEIRSIGRQLRQRSATLGRAVDVDPLTLLAERAAIAGFHRGGTISCGRATRLLEARNGWLAVSLARPDDVDLVPAWLERAVPLDDPWAVLSDVVGSADAEELVERGVLLGLPVADLPKWPVAGQIARTSRGRLPLKAQALPGPAASPQPLTRLRVVDLSSLWAGPLCGSLLAAAGADVIKVESTERPDGTRRGPAPFFDLLNAGKRSVALDLRSDGGRQALHGLLRRADVVIEASRPRALEQLGIDAAALVSGGGPRVWASITGHGRTGDGRDRVAFGDDAAVAGGLVSWDQHGPCFCVDAIADPATGLVAAAAALDALARGGRWLLDLSMREVAAHLAGPTLPSRGAPEPAPPVARPVVGPAPKLGQDTASVLAELR